jgi:hypothetical protein
MQGCAIPALLPLLWSSQLVLKPSRLVFLGQSVGKRAALHLHLHLHLGPSSCGPLANTHDRRPQPTAHSPQQLACSAIAPPAPSHIQHRRLPQCQCSASARPPVTATNGVRAAHFRPIRPAAPAPDDTTRQAHQAPQQQQQRVDTQPRRTPHAGLRFRRAGSALLLRAPGIALRAPRTDPSTARRWRKQGSFEAWRC